MKTTVSKEFCFEAAHSLPHLPDGHKCKRPHGHSYRVTVHVTGDIDPAMGWFIDYADISRVVKALVVDVLDHRDLNAFMPVSTAERLAEWIWAACEPELPGLSAVDVHETATTRVRLDSSDK